MTRLVVDAETLGEFLAKATPFLPDDLLRTYGSALRLRSRLASDGLSVDRAWQLAPATRRLPKAEREAAWPHVQEVWKPIERDDARAVLALLDDWPARPGWAVDWATFWLACRRPDEAAWWARWVYRPPERTGALTLVVADLEGLDGGGLSATYERVRQASAFVGAVLDSLRALTPVPDEHRSTVALASVYAVYMFTMAAWRMTPEFTQVMPPFPRVVQKLLGIDGRWEATQDGAEGEGG